MKFNLNYACLGLPGCSHPVGYLCGCSCHKSDKETEHDEVPMGISNWINHGKQYYYFDYVNDKRSTSNVEWGVCGLCGWVTLGGGRGIDC